MKIYLAPMIAVAYLSFATSSYAGANFTIDKITNDCTCGTVKFQYNGVSGRGAKLVSGDNKIVKAVNGWPQNLGYTVYVPRYIKKGKNRDVFGSISYTIGYDRDDKCEKEQGNEYLNFPVGGVKINFQVFKTTGWYKGVGGDYSDKQHLKVSTSGSNSDHVHYSIAVSCDSKSNKSAQKGQKK